MCNLPSLLTWQLRNLRAEAAEQTIPIQFIRELATHIYKSATSVNEALVATSFPCRSQEQPNALIPCMVRVYVNSISSFRNALHSRGTTSKPR